jgi:multicomponent Na+:H+ antiporter subunit D
VEALPVAIPLLMAAALAAAGKHLPRWLNDAVALAASVACLVLCAALFVRSRHEPIVYWMAGWQPRGGIALGISFVIDPLGAGLATLSALLVVAALVFALRYFDDVQAHFHVLMLAFLGALCGFGLTGDLFNLFVFFELMSAAAFALCGYKSDEPASLQGALHFAVVNTAGAFFVLSGIALLYGRTGALNMAQIGRALGGRADGLVIVAFALIACGLLVKGAMAPFHFWLADAHAVAPTPVCILFSGVMVEAGLYGIVRVYGTVFGNAFAPHVEGLRPVLLGFGAMTALVGGLLCLAQRHLKRLLAFSTVSHMGVLTCGFGLLGAKAISGAALYVAGHGFVKAALFVCAGILLHRFRSIDELKLHGRGRGVPGVGILMALGGLWLSGLAPTALFLGEAEMEHAAHELHLEWLPWVFVAAGVLTGGAVLRACSRIFLGWGPREEDAPPSGGESDEGAETQPSGSVPASMWGVAAVLLALALAVGLSRDAREVAHTGASFLLDTSATAAHVLDGKPQPPAAAPEAKPIGPEALRSCINALLAVGVAAALLARKRFPSWIRTAAAAVWNPLLGGLRAVHTGRLGDSLAWLAFGTAAFGGLCAALLR